MGKFDLYKVDLKGMASNVQEYEYLLQNRFFADIDGDDVQKGKVNVKLSVKKLSGMFELSFELEGVVVIPCDRCLDDMEFPITAKNRLVVKLGKDYSEESDEIVVIPESEGIINLAWFLYEFIVLNIPIKHVHAPGKCNKTMTSKLKKHTPKGGEDDENEFGGEDAADDIIITDDEGGDDSADPRWDALKGFADNDNN